MTRDDKIAETRIKEIQRRETITKGECMNTDELEYIIREHKKWLAKDGGAQANLREADLSEADLSGADLRGADLGGANLSGADLSGANLALSNLRRANLSGAKYSADIIISSLRKFDDLYRYVVIAIIDDKGEQWVRMGCRLRKRSEWANDFWDNDEEFPNNGNKYSSLRLLAYEYACGWLDLESREETQVRETTNERSNV